MAGAGGDGIMMIGQLLAHAAVLEGKNIVWFPSYGPESRGGACSAQLILSDEPILYPYVARPDILVAMSHEAYSRFVPELKDDGLLLVEQDLVQVSDLPSGVRVHAVPATRLAEELGRKMVLNLVMVGFFAAVTQLLDPQALRQAVEDSVPPAFRDLNRRAFDKGFEFAVPELTRG